MSGDELREALNLDGDAVARDATGGISLIGAACAECAKRVFPPAPVCPDCMSENMERVALSREGTLYSYSLVHAAPRGWRLPFVAAYVDLPEDVRVFAHIVECDPQTLEVDMKVALCAAILGEDETGAALEGFAFRPADGGKG
jgi:uncharacterized OB-fold protein